MSVRTLLVAATLPLSLIATVPAHAAQYTIFVYETPADFHLRDEKTPESGAYWAAYADFATVLQESGAIRGGAPLKAPSTALTIQGASQPRSGAYPQNGLHLGGYFQIEVPTLEAALNLARRAPSLARGGAVEVRETYPAPTMAGQ